MRARSTLPLLAAAAAGCLQFDVQPLPNQPPQPQVTVDPSGPVTGGTVVTLDASATTDPDEQDRNRLTFRWQQVAGDPVALDTFSLATVHFPAPRVPQTLLFFVHVSDGIAEATSAQVKVEVVNRAPQVPEVEVDPAGPVTGGTLVTLDASATTDEDPGDAEALVFRWQQVAGDAVPLTSYTAPLTQFEAPRRPQTLIFFLNVTDGVNAVARQVTVPVSSRTAPVAFAGEDQVVSLGQRVLLDASGSSDADNDALSFEWNQFEGPEVPLDGARSVRATFTAPANATQLGFRVTVSDGQNTDSDDVVVKVEAVPEARIKVGIGSLEPVYRESGSTVAVGDRERVVLDGGDSRGPPGGSALTFEWVLPAELLVINPGLEAELTQQSLNFATPSRATVLPLRLKVRAQDAEGQTVQSPDARVSLVVNPRPEARPATSALETLNRTPVRLDGSSSLGAVTYDWRVLAAPPGGECCLHDAIGCPTGLDPPQPAVRKCLSGAQTPSPIFTPYARGDHTVQLVVYNQANVASFPAYVLVTAKNNRPRAIAGPDLTTPNNAALEMVADYRDPDGDLIDPIAAPGTDIRLEVKEGGLPTGATFDLEQDALDPKTFTFRPHGKGAYFLQLTVHDGIDASDPDGIIVAASNVAPIAAPVTPVAGRNRTPITLRPGNTRDPDGDAITYLWSVVETPQGATATLSDPNAAMPTLTPTGKGTYKARLVVADADELSAPAEVVVDSQNNPPVADAGPDIADHTQTVLRLDGGASRDLDGDALTAFTWRKISGPSLSSFTGTDTSTPEARFAATGAYQFGLTVSDGAATSEEAILKVTVTRLNRPPVADAGADQTASPGATVTLHGNAVDPEGDNIQSYLWTRESDHPDLPMELIGRDPTFVAPPAFDAGDPAKNKVIFRLEATDAFGAVSSPDRVNVFLSPDESTFVFVSRAGTDTPTCGGAATPCKSITRGIDRAMNPARAATGRNVLVTAGLYDDEPVRTLRVPYGVKLLGGWDPTTFRRDPKTFVSEIKWSGPTRPEIGDGHDNDCDGRVDEKDVPLGIETCNHVDDDENGTVDDGCGNLPAGQADPWEPNNTLSTAKEIDFGRPLARLTYYDDDYFAFTIPYDIPGDPDGSGPEVALHELYISWTGPSSATARAFTLYKMEGASPVTLQVLSSTSNVINISRAPPILAGNYVLAITGGPVPATTQHNITLDIRVRQINEVGVGGRPMSFQLPATFFIPPRASPPEEERVPVIEGFRIHGPPLGIPATAAASANASTRVIQCELCTMRLRDNEIIGDASQLAGASAWVVVLNAAGELLPPLQGEADPGVIVERNLIRIPLAKFNRGLYAWNSPDFVVRGNTFLANAFRSGEASEYFMIHLDGNTSSNGSRRGYIHRNYFRMEGTGAIPNSCIGINFNYWKDIHVYDNVFDVQSDCGGLAGGANYDNRALYQSIGSTGRRVLVANNVFLAKPDIQNRNVVWTANSGSCTPIWVFRNNFLRGFDRGLDDCNTQPNLIQWNAFDNVTEVHRLLTSPNTVTTLAQLQAEPQGKLGSRAESTGNFVAACTFEDPADPDAPVAADYVGKSDSPCLDKGSVTADVPDGATMLRSFPLLLEDANGAARPKDLSSVANATGGDGTDIGPVERQQ